VTPAGAQAPFAHVLRLRLAPRTGTAVYWVREGSPSAGGIGVVADGTLAGAGLAQPGRIVFSRDGSRWAAVGGTPPTGTGEAVQRGPTVVFADGREVGRAVDVSFPTFSSDGKHLAYLAERDDTRIALMVDGVEQRVYEDADNPCTLVSKVSDVGPNLPPQFSVDYLSDGSLLVVTEDRDGWAVFRDGTRLASYPGSRPKSRTATQLFFGGECASAAMLVPDSVAIAAQAPVAAWWERVPGETERWRVVVDGKPVDDTVCGGYWDDPTPEISADGKHVAYPCRSADPLFPDRISIVADGGRRWGPYHDVWSMAFSDDGQHLAWDAVAYGGGAGDPDRQWQLWLDGVAFPRHVNALWHPRLSTDSRWVAWAALPAYGARGILGVNRRQLGGFDDLLWGPTFIRPDAVSWIVRHGRRITRLEFPLP